MPRENEPAKILSGMPPTWMMVLGSVAIALHLLLAFILTLNQPSGPWPVQGAGLPADPPRFVSGIGNHWLTNLYHNTVRSNHSFHFSSNRQEGQEISFDGLIKDDKGTVIKKISIPDPEAPSSIQVRQRLLAQQLGSDEPLPPQTGVIIAPAGKELEPVRWWHQDADRRFILKTENPNAVPRNQSFMHPTDAQLIIARAYSRFLSRQNAGARVELNRNWYDPILPMVLVNDPPPNAADLRHFSSSYGELIK